MGEMYIPVIKQQLQQQLGSEKFLMYVRLLRDWFCQRLTKNLFDHEISTLLEGKCLDLHNLLVRSILQSAVGSSSSGPSGISIQPYVPYASSQSAITSVNFTGDTTVAVYTTPTDVHYPTPISESNSGIPYDGQSISMEDSNVQPPVTVKETAPPVIEVRGAVDMMDHEPPQDCDWLLEAKVTYPATEDNIPDKKLYFKNRFPPWFAHDFQRVNRTNYAQNVNIVRNVTHVNTLMKDMLERKPHLKQHFVIPGEKKQPHLTSGASLYGRILIKAWENNIQNVNLLVAEHASNAVRDHIKSIIIKVLQQRRPFRMRDKRIMHSVGVPYPNPYLRQGFHLYDEAYGSDTTKMADVVMQVPAPFPTIEEKERLAALQVAASYPSRESRFISAKGTMTDLLLALNQNPTLIPNNRSRFKLIDATLKNNKGLAGSQNTQYACPDEEEDIFQPSPLLPLASY